MKEPKWLAEERKKTEQIQVEHEIQSPKPVKVKNSKNVKIFSFEEMLEKDQKFAKDAFIKRKKSDSAYFGYLNSRFNECNFIFVAKGKKAELDLVFNSVLAINFIFVEEGANLALTNAVSSNSILSSDIKLEQGAQLNSGLLKHKGIWVHSFQNNILGTEAKTNSICFWSGNGTSEVQSHLQGLNSRANQICLSTCGKDEKTILNSSALHSANNTSSNLIMRGVVQDNSQITLNGGVVVEHSGNGSKSNLSQDVLLLDKNAKAEANPILEIKHSNVECSHSAVVRKIDEEKLFYLQSRGLDKNLAETTIVTGFLRSAINKTEDKELRNMFKPSFMQE